MTEDLAGRFEQEGVRDIECIFADVSAYPRGKLMPAASFAGRQELRISQAIAMQCVTGEYSEAPIFADADPDVRLVPDMDTLKRVPWSSAARYLAIHDCVELDGSPCAFAPRSVLKLVVERYRAAGFFPQVAPEIEFYLVAAQADAAQAFVLPAGRGGRPEAGQSAFSLNLLHELEPFWDEFRSALDLLGIRADTWLHEVGPSQYEINLLHGEPVSVADQAFLFKYAAREIALKHGMNAVFMAKPFAAEAGSSMHLHQSVIDASGANIFSRPDGSASPVLLHYIGGLQAHLPSLMLVFAPFVNSYKRYVSGSQAPVNSHWGYDNRTAGLRVPISAPAARRVENRIAGADANPYLAIAASLAAGLAGVQSQMNATDPVDGNAYRMTSSLPATFEAAHRALSTSPAAPSLLGSQFVEAYLAVKDMEYASYLREISPWERRFLMPCA